MIRTIVGWASSRQGCEDVPSVERAIVIRLARDADLPQLWDLSELDSSPPLSGPILIAVVDEEVWAALALTDGRALADPFRPSAAAVTLLRVRGEQLTGDAPGTSPRLRRASAADRASSAPEGRLAR